MGTRPEIELKRAYDAASEADGFRILVERLWPRGVSKQDARIDLWAKEVAPSTELRKWFGHDPDKWEEFRRRYTAELEARPGALDPLLEQVRAGKVTFVYGSRETRFNNAAALREFVLQALRG